jgi:hypothetical protein
MMVVAISAGTQSDLTPTRTPARPPSSTPGSRTPGNRGLIVQQHIVRSALAAPREAYKIRLLRNGSVHCPQTFPSDEASLEFAEGEKERTLE